MVIFNYRLLTLVTVLFVSGTVLAEDTVKTLHKTKKAIQRQLNKKQEKKDYYITQNLEDPTHPTINYIDTSASDTSAYDLEEDDSLVEDLGEVVADASEVAVDVAAGTLDVAADAAQAIGTEVVEGAQAAAQVVGNVAATASQFVGQACDAVSHEISDIANSDTAHAVVDAVHAAGDFVGQEATEFGNAVAAEGHQLADNISDLLNDASNSQLVTDLEADLAVVENSTWVQKIKIIWFGAKIMANGYVVRPITNNPKKTALAAIAVALAYYKFCYSRHPSTK